MVLQNLIFQNKEMPGSEKLYYHSDAKLQIAAEGMHIPAGKSVCFDTYFNVFLSKTWMRYTAVKQICIYVSVSGKGTVRIWGEKEKPLAEQSFSGEQELTFSVNLKESLYLYLEVCAEEPVLLFRGSIAAAREHTDNGKQQKKQETEKTEKVVKLALVICTYNRKQDITRNLCLLKRYNRETENEEPVLEQIYVVDNARNLEPPEIEGERVLLIPNRNTGGAGGFTKGLEEAIKKRELTHIILMDDDVHIEFEAFCRTKSFLSYIKPEYAGHFLGGAMLRTDVPYLLHAAGEDWADGFIRNPYKSTDLREFSHVLHISKPVETKQAYAGWWYCCIPRSHVEQKGYPMPFFLHCDDVEYSLRSGKAPIFLNGVAVWHEEFEDKRASVMEYYDVRNRLITNAIYKDGKRRWNAETIILERFLACVLRYRYKDIDLIIQAVDDFLKGSKWLKNLESGKYHKKLMEIGYKLIPIETARLTVEEKDISKFVTVLRYFAPAHGIGTIRVGSLVSSYAGKKEVVLIDTKNQTGIVVKKSWKETFIYAGRITKCSIRMYLIYKRKVAEWEDLARLNKTEEKRK